MTPTVTYRRVGGRLQRTTTWPVPSPEERARQYVAGQRAFLARPMVLIEFVDDEPDADTPLLVDA